MTRTQWFPASINPVHVGWYEVKCKHYLFGYGGELLWWNGKKWRYGPRTTGMCSFGLPCDSWRGLTQKGKA